MAKKEKATRLNGKKYPPYSKPKKYKASGSGGCMVRKAAHKVQDGMTDLITGWWSKEIKRLRLILRRDNSTAYRARAAR